MDIEDLKARRDKIHRRSEDTFIDAQRVIDESLRIAGVASNSGEIIDDIDKEFKRITALNDIDISFMLFSAMLQSLRWALLEELNLTRIGELAPGVSREDRLRANERNHVGGIYDGKSSGSEYEHEALAKYIDEHNEIAKKSEEEFYKRKNKYRSWIEIITQPVPYDAMNGIDKNTIPNIANLNKQNPNGTYSNIFGKNHHVATLGHDPILGWLFGTANIMTSTVSFVDFQNYRVQRGHKIKSLGEFVPTSELLYSDQVIDYSSPCNILGILNECILSAKEDNKRVAAAVAKQAMHLASDKYCIEGLPFPLLSVMDTQKAQELIEEGWNSVEFERLFKNDIKQIGISAGISVLINLILEAIYLLFVRTEEELGIKRVKMNKILSISDIIASSSNVLFVALTNRYSKIDIGGIGVTMLELLHSETFINNVKQEYISNQFERLVMYGGVSDD